MGLAGVESELADVVDRVRPTVVRVRRLAPRSAEPRIDEASATATGVIVESRGLVLTNDHVVRGARRLEVDLGDGRSLEAGLLGRDRATDLAVLRVGAGRLPAASLGDSDQLRVGQFVVAVGNSLGLPGGPTVSLGVLSATGRALPGADYVVEGFLQTDAAINPGNSGGPLVDLAGRVIGINTAMIPFAQGIGFAIPSNTARHVFEQLRQGGRVSRPWLGAHVVSVTETLARRNHLTRSEGVLLVRVHPQSPAALAGLRAGDILVRVGIHPIFGLTDLLRALAELPLGGAVDLEYHRGRLVRRGVLRVLENPPELESD